MTREGQVTEKLVSAERSGERILRIVDLPVQVDTERVTGSLEDGILELTLPMAVVANPAQGGSMAA